MLVIIFIMFISLALTKMDCNRIANYLLLPVFLGLGYINWAHYHRTSWTTASGGGDGDEMRSKETSGADGNGNPATLQASGAQQLYSKLSSLPSDSETSLIDHNKRTVADLINGSRGSFAGTTSDSIVDSIELTSTNGLAILALLHLTANLFNKQLAKILN